MSSHRGLFVRGPTNPNGTAQWIKIGTLIKEADKEYVLMETLALNPSVVTLAADKGQRILANLYEVEPPKKKEQQVPRYAPGKGREKYSPPLDNFDDDIPF